MSFLHGLSSRQKAAAILGVRKLQMLEEAGLAVVEAELLGRIDVALFRAPWPRNVDHDGYEQWYERYLEPAHAEIERVLKEYVRSVMRREAMEKDEPTRTD